MSLPKLEILFEDNHLFVVNKPAGIPTQPDDTGQPNLLIMCREWIKEAHAKPGNVYLETVHRIDKPVSGVVLFAKTSKSLSRLNEAMRSRQMCKTYLAQVAGLLPDDTGTLLHHLIHGDHRAIISKPGVEGAKEARLSYRVLSRSSGYCTIEIDLETGRYHQIRAQFAAIGHPILGDMRYGGPPIQWGEGIALHHARLELIHPVIGTSMIFEAPSPFPV